MYFKKIVLAAALLGLAILAYFSYYIYKATFAPNTVFKTEEVYITIPTGASYPKVIELLKPLLKNIGSFDALARQKKYVNNVKPGRYRIKKGMANNAIINSIRSKNIPIEVVFNNQNSIYDLANRISQQIEADSTALVKAFLDSTFLEKNKFEKHTVLGMFIPNSYEFFWNTSAEVFRDRMLKEYHTFWNKSRIQRAKQLNMSLQEVIILASIVHEESKQTSEQARIAGVYINRLKNNWLLQADPTLKFAAYQLPDYKGSVIKRILNKHKTIKSPYNTYMYNGLPPGLIAMPDISAIDAVLNYESHDYFYFVADPKNPGFHKFSKTLAQHNVYAKEYHNYLSANKIR